MIRRRKNANDIVEASRRADDTSVLVNRLEELTDDKRDRLDALDSCARISSHFRLACSSLM